MTALSTVRAALMTTSWYASAITAIAFWWVIAMIEPFTFFSSLIMWMLGGAFWSNWALLVADPISWFILFGRGAPSSPFEIRHHSAMLDPDVRAGPGPVDAV